MMKQTVLYRFDDGNILVSTDAYVSHHKDSGPLKSTFSMSVDEAVKLRDDLTMVIDLNT